jgi:hypothetical protein
MMTKLEELKTAYHTAYATYAEYARSNDDTNVVLMRSAYAARKAYTDERKKQEIVDD